MKMIKLYDGSWVNPDRIDSIQEVYNSVIVVVNGQWRNITVFEPDTPKSVVENLVKAINESKDD